MTHAETHESSSNQTHQSQSWRRTLAHRQARIHKILWLCEFESAFCLLRDRTRFEENWVVYPHLSNRYAFGKRLGRVGIGEHHQSFHAPQVRSGQNVLIYGHTIKFNNHPTSIFTVNSEHVHVTWAKAIQIHIPTLGRVSVSLDFLSIDWWLFISLKPYVEPHRKRLIFADGR